MDSRRSFLRSAGLAATAFWTRGAEANPQPSPLQEFGYGSVDLAPGPAQAQFEQTCAVLMSLNEDSLLKPWRLRAGLPAPGPELGGWYDEVPLKKTESGGHGFAPAHCFGQWISALSRGYAITRAPEIRARLERLLALYEATISGRFYTNFRFPAYTYDKMVIGLIDAHEFAGLSQAYALLDRTTDAAEPHLPPEALNRGEPQRRWRESVGDSERNASDESYTLSENLYLAAERGAGERYRKMAPRFLLDDTWFTPLSENKNVLPHHHAYSFCNSLSSAMQAYLAGGSRKHLLAARNAFDMIVQTQSFATGGWGPNESFVAPGEGKLYGSLATTHRSFETPCGSYAHFKVARYLLRVTRDGRYGDSMERVLYNTVLGAKPLQRDGRAFYYSDYNDTASKVYFPDQWPCCSGTLPQVAADYRLLICFRDTAGVFVNLYLPSTLRWTDAEGAQLALTQSGPYPVEGRIAMRLSSTRPVTFALRLRIPAWVGQARISINGKRISAPVQTGFVRLQRTWLNGDRIQLEFELPMRLEPIEPDHPNTVAMIRGPLVLFAVGGTEAPVSRRHLLAAERLPNAAVWRVRSSSGAMQFRPFSAINDEPYRTYLNVD